MTTISEIENMPEGRAIAELRKWSSEALKTEAERQSKRNDKASSFGDTNNRAGAMFLMICIDRVLDMRN